LRDQGNNLNRACRDGSFATGRASTKSWPLKRSPVPTPHHAKTRQTAATHVPARPLAKKSARSEGKARYTLQSQIHLPERCKNLSWPAFSHWLHRRDFARPTPPETRHRKSDASRGRRTAHDFSNRNSTFAQLPASSLRARVRPAVDRALPSEWFYDPS